MSGWGGLRHRKIVACDTFLSYRLADLLTGKIETRSYSGRVLEFSDEYGMLVRFDGYDDNDEEAEVRVGEQGP